MGSFIIHFLLNAVFSGLVSRTDLLRPPAIFLPAEAAQAPDPAETPKAPKKIDEASLGVVVSAPTAAVIDTRSGEILFSQGDDRIVPIASITKLMTAMVVLESNPDWNAPVEIVQGDNALEGIPYLKVGDRLTARQTFDVMLVGSANNAAMALSRSLGMSRQQFVGKMNAKARELGLAHTAFVDPTGYHPDNRSSALDVARLVAAALARAEIRETSVKTSLDVRTAAGALRHVPSTDELLQSFLNQGEYQIVGGKTGYTEEAGYTLVLRAKKGAADVIAVILGAPTSEDRFKDAKALLFWSFKTFEW